MMEQPAFGQRLKALRSERGLSQAALAAGAMSTGYLSRLESGARPPTKRVVQHLAQRLGIPASAFGTAQVSSTAQVIALAASTPTGVPSESLTGALQADGEGDGALRWLALWYRSRIAAGRQERQEEYDLLLEAARLGADLGSPELRVRPLVRLSRCAAGLGDYAAARKHALDAHGLAAALPAADQAAVLQALLSAEAKTGRLTEARAHAEELCRLTEPAGGPLFVEALRACAGVRSRQGDHAGARDVLQQALDQTSSRTDLNLWVPLQLAEAALSLQVKPPLTDRVHAVLGVLAPVLGVVGTELQRQQVLTLRAHLAYEEGRFDEARALCDELGGQALQLSFRERIRFQALRNQLLIRSGRADDGVAALGELAREAADACNVELSAEVWQRLAETLASVRGCGVPRGTTGSSPADPYDAVVAD
jgi:transcriptional regulator with XRE-family HTH domain